MKAEVRRFGSPQDEVLLHLLENKGHLATWEIADLMFPNVHTARVWNRKEKTWVYKNVPGGPNFRFATLEGVLRPLRKLKRIVQEGREVHLTPRGEEYILYRIKWAKNAGRVGFKGNV